jgi:hypothetical protein
VTESGEPVANTKVFVSEQDRQKLEDLKASEKLIAQLNETWEEKLSRAEELKWKNILVV